MDDAVESLRAAYNAVPYESHAFPQSAPGWLAAVAYLFGLHPPVVSSARVLEIGCSSAGNLVPFAAWHPGTQAVGIDFSEVQIDQGRRRIEALGLANVELIQADISDIDSATLGKFDYIICHGVYSWVPEGVQEAILAAFRDLLAPTGVAYISYNTYPGWKAKEIIRDAMMLRGGARGTPAEKLGYARGMIDFLEQVAPADSVLAKALAEHREMTRNASDSYVLHEHLETFNAPSYFLAFGERAGSHGLCYLADAEPQTMFAINYGDKVSTPLLKECGHQQVLVEQYLDFVVNRAFRQSLVAHAERAPDISYQVDRSRFRRLHFAAWLPPSDGPAQLDNSSQAYGDQRATVATSDAGVKAAIAALNARWPWTLSWYELLYAVHAQLGQAGVAATGDLENKVDELLEILVVRGLTRYRLDPVLPEPVRGPLRLDEATRRMAALVRDDEESFVFNAWHEPVPLSHGDRHLLPLLDGTRDRDALVDILMELMRNDVIRFVRDGEPLSGESQLRAVAEHVDTMPQRLEQMKLLRIGTDE